MTKFAGLPRRPQTRHLINARRAMVGAAILAVAASLSACATSGVVSEAGTDAAWEGAKPKPIAMSSYAPAPRIGSQPLLPPVPEDGSNGLAPVKISALTE